MTPVTHSWSPVEVAAVPVTLQTGASRFVRRYSNQPHYAALIDPGKRSAEMRCLAEAIYFEARSEPELGQSAVAQVVMNRVASSLYPDSICGRGLPEPPPAPRLPVHLRLRGPFPAHSRNRRPGAAPSVWRRRSSAARPLSRASGWPRTTMRITSIRAGPARSCAATKIGRHIFYQLRPGQR